MELRTEPSMVKQCADAFEAVGLALIAVVLGVFAALESEVSARANFRERSVS
ncbi:hypothetical protein AB0I77_26575 [Streptomyces sp. NPDC050619]|uniref:hypothetical protein n=1 Tax=Streptomyces sp. NPDC050619 TaxID=3157214 RepID=UPI00341B2A7F